jgi:hypothetical protein
MAGGIEGERPRDARTPAQSQQQEHADPRQGRPADSPLAPARQEQPYGEERSHEALVAAFRQAIRRSRQRELEARGEHWSPVHIIQSELFHQAQFRYMSDRGRYAAYKQLGEFYTPIYRAWDVIAYEHFGRGSDDMGAEGRHAARLHLSRHMKQTGQTVITLSAQQTRILDALAEAADIPHQKGHTDIEIPEYLRGYEDR